MPNTGKSQMGRQRVAGHEHLRMTEIEHAERLANCFGHWPDFHDAELRALRIDTERAGGPVLAVDIDVTEYSPEVDARGYYIPRQSCRTTLRFRNVTNVAMDSFGAQNVLDALDVRVLEPEQADERAAPWGARRLEVEFVPIPGFCGLTFLCDGAEVVRAESTLAPT